MSVSKRHVRLFRTGQNQTLRIPFEFQLDSDEAIIHKDGDRLIIEPVCKGRLLELLATLEPLDVPFPDMDNDLESLGNVTL
ncbi:MAG: AbrB/MazE/SpoVT family DNA-binding domain-containing protein [Wenzhouxiangellaceae bacterium]